MGWRAGFVHIEYAQEQQQVYEGNIILKKIKELVIRGKTLSGDSYQRLPGVQVKAFALGKGGREISLGHSFSGGDGYYILNIDKSNIPSDTVAIMVRSGAAGEGLL